MMHQYGLTYRSQDLLNVLTDRNHATIHDWLYMIGSVYGLCISIGLIIEGMVQLYICHIFNYSLKRNY